MPELPEVETITRQLNKVLTDRVIAEIKVLREKSFRGIEKEFRNRKIERVERKAKMIIIEFANWDRILMIHLKMTGQLIFVDGDKRISGGHPSADWIKDLPSKYTRVIIDFLDGTKLYFNDLRVFGWVREMANDDYEKLIKKLPPDVVDENFTLEYFQTILTKGGRPIKLVLTDQEKMGGIGNIYANDALFYARIDPRRKAKELTEKEVEVLYKSVKKVIEMGIRYGGASVDKYVDSFGQGGKYQEHFQVYKKEGEKCSRGDGIIKRLKMGGRGTFYCPGCQK